ncbi:zinc finger MYM-type protein 1-like [Hydra vulgaris]|uniref:zinc finger MYM-type protein 1-like n=1 Tax=Hydra vulgaris TaxID=6087 RepID=UPI001F5F1D03|nr:zinc finger MYM-type protein 1-like [Hydra vulgaris]
MHSSSQHHIEACAVLELWKKNKTIDQKAEDEIRYRASFWQMVLERLFRITLMLSKNSLAFRGHLEGFTEDYNGNFLSQVQLLFNYDSVMKQILEMPSGSIRYLSPTTQNELIHCLGKKLLNDLIANINSSSFYALMLDTTQDITKRDQLSVIIRHVHIVRNVNQEPTHFKIKDTFNELKDHSAEGMTNQVLTLLKEAHIPIEKCYGQGYDGANVMSGVYSGVQTRIKQIQPNAEYVHCNSHNLNLVINDYVNGSYDILLFYATLQNIYLFFGNSIKRWDLLSIFTGESEVTLKKLNPTQWSGRLQSLTAVKVRFIDILKALTEIIFKSTKKEEREEALQIKKKMGTFDFVFISVFLFKEIDLEEATEVLKHVREKLNYIRNSYEQIKLEAEELARKCDIETNFQSKRQPVKKRHFDELASDHRFQDREQLN